MKIQQGSTRLLTLLILIAVSILTLGQFAIAADTSVIVNVDNFVRAETAMQFDRMVKMAGGVNKLGHNRQPTPLDKQSVIRMNRDTLYSFAIVDISKGATLTLPDSGKRYMSVMVVNEDHYINKVFHGGGTYKLTVQEFDTSYILLAGRTLVNSSDEADIKAANALQDKMAIKAVSAKPYTHPSYDEESYKKTLNACLELSRGVGDTKKMFGKKTDVDQVRHLLGTAFGWGGLPIEEAFYLNVEPGLPVGEYQITVKDVPVNAFWSISLYNKKGFFEKNDFNAYSVNNISGKPHKDGSFTVHFGGCEDKRVNCLPIMDGWNYAVRMYQPRKEILDGKWPFPRPKLVK
jgi:hypothetical protein